MPPLRHTPLLPLLDAFTADHLFLACTVNLDPLIIVACIAFIRQRPFVVARPSIDVDRQPHTLHRSSGIIVDSLLAHPRLSAHSQTRPLERIQKYLAYDLEVVEYSVPCFRSRMVYPIKKTWIN